MSSHKPEPNVITLSRKIVCPKCGMAIEKGTEMYRSLTKPNIFICATCAITEQKERKKRSRV